MLIPRLSLGKSFGCPWPWNDLLLDYPEKEEIGHDWAEKEYEYVLKMRARQRG